MLLGKIAQKSFRDLQEIELEREKPSLFHFSWSETSISLFPSSQLL